MEKAAAYGLPGVRVDGNDVLAVRKVVGDAMDRARAGEGGTLIEALTYRIGPHSTSDDPTVYRSEKEVLVEEKDPIPRFAAFLKGRGLLGTRSGGDEGKGEGKRRGRSRRRRERPRPALQHVRTSTRKSIAPRRAARLHPLREGVRRWPRSR